MLPVQNVGSDAEKCVGWSFDNLNKETDKVKKIRDPLSVLIYAAVFPFFKEGSKVSLANHTITVQHPADYTYSIPIVNVSINFLRAIRSPLWGSDNINNLEFFHLGTINATEYFDPINDPIIRTLFESARDGISSVKDAYKDQSTPQDVIDKYKGTIVKALAGEFKFNKELSQAEIEVKKIWSSTEISWINLTLKMMTENKLNNKCFDAELSSILEKLNAKEIEFNKICEKVKAKALSTFKAHKPQDPPPPPPKVDELQKQHTDALDVKETKEDLGQNEEADKQEGASDSPSVDEQVVQETKAPTTQPKSNLKKRNK